MIRAVKYRSNSDLPKCLARELLNSPLPDMMIHLYHHLDFKGCLSGKCDKKAYFALWIAVTDWKKSASAPQEAESSSDGTSCTRRRQNRSMVMGACPEQTPML